MQAAGKVESRPGGRCLQRGSGAKLCSGATHGGTRAARQECGSSFLLTAGSRRLEVEFGGHHVNPYVGEEKLQFKAA